MFTLPFLSDEFKNENIFYKYNSKTFLNKTMSLPSINQGSSNQIKSYTKPVYPITTK